MSIRWTRSSMVGLAALVLACGERRRAPVTDSASGGAAAADSTSAASAVPPRTAGLQHPESARYDAELDLWYVSNINGSRNRVAIPLLLENRIEFQALPATDVGLP